MPVFKDFLTKEETQAAKQVLHLVATGYTIGRPETALLARYTRYLEYMVDVYAGEP